MLKIKLCPFCLDFKVTTDKQHEKECKDKTPQYSESWKCASSGCGKHSWIRQTHADNANKKKLKKYSERMHKKGFDFSFPLVFNNNAVSCNLNQSAREDLEQQFDKELLPVPDGHTMFLFFGAKGKTRSLMVFFDSGCSRFIMRDSIPGKELPASCLRNEKIPIGGVGATTVFAEGEYLVAMETIDGKAQLMQGLTVKDITSDFPQLDITSAAAEVTEAVPRNKGWDIKRCKLPKSIGGTVDCLVGIQYNHLQPKLIHMLPSGLAIYKTKLAPHTKGYNFVLGGPHSSFDILLNQHGNQNHLLDNFIAGLANWRNLGPPSLSQYVMSVHEVSSAIEKNLVDDQLETYKELVKFEQEEFEKSQHEVSDPTLNTVNVIDTDDISASLSENFEQSCYDCGVEVLGLHEDQKISRMRQILDSQETGLDISYRCIRCRDCQDCKNAEKVDKISLREEAEDYEIKKSVVLDWNKKEIRVSLPLRGKESDFLSSNQDRALKILNSQCRKYFQDVETKITVNAAFKKLIDKGFIKFLKDITDEEKNKFIHKEVQYFLPWRIQFKPGSASTPVRVVFDASSRTAKRPDNSGGRCLNDLVCKGPIDSMDLMRVILRFVVGQVALVADLSKMYNQFSLLPEFWNLQRILIRDDLNPEAPLQHACVTTAIYGVKSSAGQTEHGLKEVAEDVKVEKPDVAKLLTVGRYVDNLLDSKVKKEDAIKLAEDTTEVLNRLNLPTKGFSFS